MNELDKDLSAQEQVTPEDAPVSGNETSEEACGNNENVCVVEGSPAEDLAAAADTLTDESAECAVEGSPSEDIAEMADEAMAAQTEEMRRPDYHHMSKEDLLAALESIVGGGDAEAHREVAVIKQAFFAIRAKEVEAELEEFVAAGNGPEAFASTPDEMENRFKELLNQFKERRNAWLEADEQKRRENLSLKQKVIDQLKSIIEDIDNINLHFPKFQQLQNEFKAIKEIPQGAETELWKNYQAVVEQFYDRLKMNKELRDLDFKKNLETKRGLVAEAEALIEEKDVLAAFRKLQTLHETWREIGPVAKEVREEIWEQFRAASTAVRKRHQEFFETRKAQERENEELKTKLCEEAEAVASQQPNGFGAWEKATKEMLALQARWKQIGFASRKVNNALFARFRSACDDFFGRKAEFYKSSRSEFAANLAKKTELCERAEALKDTCDVKTGIEKVLELQAEWRKIGAVARKNSDAIWERFNAACNYFFDARKRQNTDVRKEQHANLEAKKEIIARLNALADEAEIEESDLRDLQTQWQGIGHVPFKAKDDLQNQYRAAVDAVCERHGLRAGFSRGGYDNRRDQRRDSGRPAGGNSERDRLYRSYEQKKAELQTYENNMGFFNFKSSAGNSMLKEMEGNIARIKDEMAKLEKKIAELDAAAEAE